MCSEMLIGHSLTSKSALALASFLPHACRSLNFLCPQRYTFHSKTAIMKPAFVHVQCIAKSILTSNLYTADLSATLLISTQALPINVDLSQYSHLLLICYSTCTECLFWVKPNHHHCFQVSSIGWQKPFNIDVHVGNFKNNLYWSSCSCMHEVKKWRNFYLPHQTWVNVPPGLCYQTVSWDRYRLFLDRGQQWHSLLMEKIYIKLVLRVRKKLIHSSVKFTPVSHARKSSPPLYLYLKTFGGLLCTLCGSRKYPYPSHGWFFRLDPPTPSKFPFQRGHV